MHETWPRSPSLLVLDGLEEFLASCPGPHSAAQLAALLLDTAHQLGQKGPAEPAGCQLVVSVRLPVEGGDGGEKLLAVQRYFLAHCWLGLETPEESSGSDGQGATKLVRARLSQPGTEDQEWLLRFEPQEEMKISPPPCPRGGERPPAAGTLRLLDLWWA